MWIVTVLALLWTACLGIGSGRVASLTRQFVEKLKTPKPTKLQDFYSEDAVLSLDKTFGFGGNFEGPEGVELFLTRMLPEVADQQPQIQILGVDEARGTSLLKMAVNGTFVRTGKDFSTTVLHILEWNQVDGKIITHVVLDLNPAQTFAAYQTNAEKYFEKLLWTLFRSPYEQLIDINSPLWQLVSDDISVKINAYPEDLLSKTEWHGKEEVVKGFKEMQDLKQNMPIYNYLSARIDLIDAKVLLSTDTEAWVRWGYKKDEDEDIVTHSVVHYVFDDDGKLVSEEITFAYSVQPWVVYPFPAPKQPEIDSKQVRKLMVTRNLVDQQQLDQQQLDQQQLDQQQLDQQQLDQQQLDQQQLDQQQLDQQQLDQSKLDQSKFDQPKLDQQQFGQQQFGQPKLGQQQFGQQFGQRQVAQQQFVQPSIMQQPSTYVQQQPAKFDQLSYTNDQTQSLPYVNTQFVSEHKAPVEQKWVFPEQAPIQGFEFGKRVETPSLVQEVSGQYSQPIAREQQVLSSQPPVTQKQAYEFGKTEQLPHSNVEQIDSVKPKEPVIFADLPIGEQMEEDKKKDKVKEEEDKKKQDDKKDDEEDEEDEDDTKDDTKLDEQDLETPVFVRIAGDVNTRIKPGFKAKLYETMPPMDVEVHGDMKTSVVTFGSGKVDSVRFVGSIDDLELEKPQFHMSKLAKEKKLQD